MGRLRYRTKIEFGVTVAVFIIGGFFAILAWDINPSADDAVGPRAVPLFIAITMLVLGALISVSASRENDLSNQTADDGDLIPAEAYEEDDFGFRDADIKRVFAVIACGFAYIALFYAFGYMLSTLLSMVLILVAFGNRHPIALIGYAIAAALIYQYIFMGLMGLHDPAGEFLDVTAVSNLISGK